MLNKVLWTSHSQTYVSVCNEENCPTKIIEVKDASIVIIVNNTADFINLDSKIVERLQEKYYSPCQMLKYPPGS